jgi:hypothetical protein
MLPQLSDIPRTAIFTAAVGYVYGSLFRVKPQLAACAFTVSAVGHIILFAIANPVFRGDGDIRSLKIHMATHAIGMTISIIAFRSLQVIATWGTLVMLGYAARQLLRTVSRLQELEDFQIEKREEKFRAQEVK